jgi:hypothetical protein
MLALCIFTLDLLLDSCRRLTQSDISKKNWQTEKQFSSEILITAVVKCKTVGAAGVLGLIGPAKTRTKAFG